MPTVTLATLDEVRPITVLCTGFEQASSHIKVDIEHSVKNYTHFIQSGIGGMLALKDDKGVIIGGLGFIISDDLHYPRKMCVETFWFVPPENRGAGIMLFNAFEKLAKERGCDYCAMIHMTDSYPKALERLYKHRGYVLAENHYLKEL